MFNVLKFKIYGGACISLLARPLAFALMISVSGQLLANQPQHSTTHQVSDYFANPLLPKTSDKKILLVHVEQSSDMLTRAYSSATFSPSNSSSVSGYFYTHKQYRYNNKEHYFEIDDTLTQGQHGAWDGQFLNWLTMRKIDLMRSLLLGSNQQNVTSLANSSAIQDVKIQYPNSLLYSPVPNSTAIHLKNGKLEYKNKSLKLRINNTQMQRGLLDLLTPNVAFYYYSHKRFGDHKTLSDFFDHWQVNSQPSIKPFKNSSNKSKPPAKQLTALKRALKNIQLRNEKAHAPNGLSNFPCQRYVHLSMPHSTQGPLMIDKGLLKDCQPAIAGQQLLSDVQWRASKTLPQAIHTKTPIIFAYAEKERLIRSIFKHLFREEHEMAPQVIGASLAQFTDGAGLLYQATSNYSVGKGHQSIHWIGDLRASLVDEQGRIRSDNGDKKLGNINEDPLVFSCFDAKHSLLRYRFSQKPLPEARCSKANYPLLEEDVGYIWQASTPFNKLRDKNRSSQRSPFQRSDYRRFIRTHIGHQEYDFVEGKRYPLQTYFLSNASEVERRNFINYVRGKDQPHKRPRHTHADSFLLGDSFQSAPIFVGKPTGNFHLLYNDHSYYTFIKQYEQRRSRVFLATQDDMLHSFNSGWYDPDKKQIIAAKPHLTDWELGQEIWAFVPFSTLPYLAAQQDKFYGVSPEHHLTLVPEKPYIFDAKVFGKNALVGQPDRVFNDTSGKQVSRVTHPDGWGTIMVVGVGLGGMIDHVNDQQTQTEFKPSYLVFDITDAEQAPKFLASIESASLGQATSQARVITQRNSQGDMDWYLVLGSGHKLAPRDLSSSQSEGPAKLFAYNLKKIRHPSVYAEPISLTFDIPNSSVVGMSTADWTLNGETDVLYVNTASHITNQHGVSQHGVNKSQGHLYRVMIQGNQTSGLSFKSETLLSTKAPLFGVPQLSLDRANNRWIYVTTNHQHSTQHRDSRYHDLQHHDPRHSRISSTQNKIIGLKEPRDSQGRFLSDSANSRRHTVQESDLLDVTDVLIGAQTGELKGVLSLQPALLNNHALALENRMMVYSEPREYVSGWQRRLRKDESPSGSNTLLGGILSQASTHAEYANCRVSYRAFIHQLRFTTGTAWLQNLPSSPAIPTRATQFKNTEGKAIDASNVSGLMLHRHNKVLNLLSVSSEGKAQRDIVDNQQVPVSSEISWREL